MKIRLLPLTLTAMLLALPFRVEILVTQTSAAAQAGGWSRNLLDGPGARTTVSLGPPDPAPQASSAGVDTQASAPMPQRCTDPELVRLLDEQKRGSATAAPEQMDAENLILAAEHRLQQQLAELKSIRAQVDALLGRRAQMEQEDLNLLANIYRSMKPEDAARILDAMPTQIVVEVIDRMREKQSAPILAGLSQEKAREVSETIATRRALPGVKKES